jgi:hypothetical protein
LMDIVMLVIIERFFEKDEDNDDNKLDTI